MEHGAKAFRLLVSPVVAIARSVHRKAQASVFMETETDFAKVMNNHQEAGTDMMGLQTQSYIHLWLKSWPYRIVRLGHELDELKTGRPFREWWSGTFFDKMKTTIVFMRFMTRLLFVYCFFYILSRGSWWPLPEPDSPFHKGNLYKFDEKGYHKDRKIQDADSSLPRMTDHFQ